MPASPPTTQIRALADMTSVRISYSGTPVSSTSSFVAHCMVIEALLPTRIEFWFSPG